MNGAGQIGSWNKLASMAAPSLSSSANDQWFSASLDRESHDRWDSLETNLRAMRRSGSLLYIHITPTRRVEVNLERRALPRRTIQLPIIVHDRFGVTTDVSGKGVRFEASLPEEPGSDIEFAVSLDRNGTESFWLRCEGRVVRVDTDDDRIFVTATIDSIAFDEPSH
jgi:hypothetical protein